MNNQEFEFFNKSDTNNIKETEIERCSINDLDVVFEKLTAMQAQIANKKIIKLEKTLDQLEKDLDEFLEKKTESV